ncbi:DNA cytosine methyltransferase [Polymorphospora rubra]|uniref:DNA cytosine methyltransferase n=1 Tax=Polymorphospora rubra TaxID=338584 RepID=UPI0034114A63
MTRPRLLDLYCCEGGASMGYHRAGFDVTGVDKNPQPRYPFAFIQADALEVLADHDFLAGFDAIAASPTCQRKARVTAWRGCREDHPNTLTPTLRALEQISIPWVVENVPEAADELRPDFLLCGTQFGLRVRRHRIFQRGNWSSYELLPPCNCYRRRDLVPFEHKDERAFADAMGCTWMTNLGGRQAIPPAYTEHIGRQLIAALAITTTAA